LGKETKTVKGCIFSDFWSLRLTKAARSSWHEICDRLQEDHRDARRYHDKQHNDDHGTIMKIRRTACAENRTSATCRNFSKLNQNNQQAYWGWRHDHSDAPSLAALSNSQAAAGVAPALLISFTS
jgi:hypothetical protein